ncbi:MAG: squalene/phytoene synthase family protein [Alphaproteobacteria bacterium]
MLEQKQTQNQAKKYDPLRSLFASYCPYKYRNDIYKLICINGEIATIREQVSEAPQGLTRLQFWLMQLESINNGNPLQTPSAEWLAHLTSTYNLSLGDLQKWILTRQKEYEPMPIQSPHNWWDYMQNTGGLTAKFWLQIINNHATYEQIQQVVNIGSIWASVGCLRAIGFHSYIRLNLLPKELLYQHGFMLPDGWRASKDDDLSPIICELNLATQAKINQIQAKTLPKSLRLHLFMASELCNHLKACEHNPFHPLWTDIPKKSYWKLFLKSFT